MLSNHGLQTLGEDVPGSLLLSRREHRDDPVHCFNGVVGMEGGEDDGAPLSRGQGHRDRLQISQLPDENHIRVLSSGRSQCLGEAWGVSSNFPLVDEAILVAVDKFDRIFDGDDVIVLRRVDEIDDRRKGSRFPRAGRARYDDQTTSGIRQLLKLGWQSELLDGHDLCWDDPENRARSALLAEEVDPEAPDLRHLV